MPPPTWKVEHGQGVRFEGGPCFIVQKGTVYYLTVGVLVYDPARANTPAKQDGVREIECLFNRQNQPNLVAREIDANGRKPPRCQQHAAPSASMEADRDGVAASSSESGGGQGGGGQGGGQGGKQPAPPPGPPGPPGPPPGPPAPPPVTDPPGVQTEPPGVQTSP